MRSLHPGVKVIKTEINNTNQHYPRVAEGARILESRLKNLMSGRVDMTLQERDALCAYLDISPIDVVMRREDLQERREFLDLRVLPDNVKTSLIILHHELCILHKNRK